MINKLDKAINKILKKVVVNIKPLAIKTIDNFMSTITVNGVTVTTTRQINDLKVRNGKVWINGKLINKAKGDKRGILKVEVNEGMVNLDTDADVECGYVNGDVNAGGDVKVNSDVHGAVSAGGDVSCSNVGGAINSGGDITADKVGGAIMAGGDVSIK